MRVALHILPVLFGSIGSGIGGQLMYKYFDWKRARREITLEPNRKGIYVDRQDRIERRAILLYIAVIGAIVGGALYVNRDLIGSGPAATGTQTSRPAVPASSPPNR